MFIFGFFSEEKEIEYFSKQFLKELKIENPEVDLIEIGQTENNEYQLVKGKFYKISIKASEIDYAYVGRVNCCRLGGCSNPQINLPNAFEYFDYFILYNKNVTVIKVKVFNYQASRGQEITVKGWLKQFEGYNGNSDLTIGKQIDGISGATVSVYGIINDIKDKTQVLQTFLFHQKNK
jgi:hypothetical protein